jgi:hypothetical protein
VDCALLAGITDTAGLRAFPDLRVNGGFIMGIPVISSNNLPHSVSAGSILALCDASQIQLAEGTINLDASREAAVQMLDNPSSSASALVSLWAANLTGIRAVRTINYRKRTDAGAAYLDNLHLA